MRATGTPVTDRLAVRSTYRSLRLGVVALLVLLTAAVVAESLRSACWLSSLSAYYWTSAHDAFVGALCAVGALLLVYTGPDAAEDALLDVAGFLAFVVALTPAEPDVSCAAATTTDAAAVLASVRTGLAALVVAGALAWAARVFLALRDGLPVAAVAARAAGGVVLLVVATLLVVAPDALVARAHGTAAVGLFVAVAAVVLRHAFAARAVSARWAVAYTVLGTAMLLTLAVVVALHATVPGWAQSVLVLETALVGLFAAFWVLQTIELWGVDVARATRPSTG